MSQKSVVHNMAHLYIWQTDHVDNTEIKSNVPNQHTLKEIYQMIGGLDCASGGI